MKIENILGENGILAKNLKDYEYRDCQIKMAKSIEKAIDEQKILIVEAGTGTGKSLAYLIPFIYWTKKNDKKVIICTYSIALQEQLIKKDLPFLLKILEVDIKFALCVGDENYLCLRKFNQIRNYGFFDTKEEVYVYSEISSWAKETETGLRSELKFKPPQNIWLKLCRESQLCFGKKCEYKNKCFYLKAKKKQFDAQILISNHHLFFANLASDYQILPSFDAIVFDEAHNLEDIATSYLGKEISNTDIYFLLNAIYNSKINKGFITKLSINEKIKSKIKEQIAVAEFAIKDFFSDILNKFKNKKNIRLKKNNLIFNSIKEPLIHLINELKEISTNIKEEENLKEIKYYITRCKEINKTIEFIFNKITSLNVHWIEILNKSGFEKVILHSNPLNVTDELKTKIFDKIAPIILTSATLTTNNSFDYIKSRIGLNNTEEIILSSPFDYKKQVILYLPQNISDPNLEPEKYQKEIGREIVNLLKITDGKTFILFTSYDMLNKVFVRVKEELKDYTHLKQTDFSAYQAIEEFKTKEKNVLWGVATFWQGVDIPGQTLECVIMTKLPFAVPDDPIIEARIEYLKKQNMNPFLNYQVPQAIILTRQGFGRLIRRKSDIGIVSLLDPRIKTKMYGKLFLNSLPECFVTLKIKEVEKIYKETIKKIRNKL